MTPRLGFPRRPACLLLGVAFSTWSALASADERLSDWILRQPDFENRYYLGTSWQHPSQVPDQAKSKHALLAHLRFGEEPGVLDAQRDKLFRWLSALPVTGRVPLPGQDPYWLLGNPAKDPLLQTGDTVVLPTRPRFVRVLGGDGSECLLGHRAGAEVRDYLAACSPAADQDEAWLIQPDGRVSRVSVAIWNERAQDEPAPGAWIWAPGRKGWSSAFSALFADFLATQGVADQPVGDGVLDQRRAQVDALKGPSADLALTSNDWGFVGLLQTPTARMRDAGDLRLGLTKTYPYTRLNFVFQPIEWLETGFRYTDVANRLYGPDIAGSQSYKDKSIDVKVKLLDETAWRPQVSMGAIDVGGTGLFAGEYVVANKRTGAFDWSLGAGWGYLGGSNNLGNPFGKSFETRQTDTGQGGTVNSQFFHGRTALFGGVQYQAPGGKWVFKLEYDGNDYQHEPQGNNRTQNSPFNVGVVYRASPGVNWHLGVERGNTVMLGLTLQTNFSKMDIPKLLDAPLNPQPARTSDGRVNWSATAGDLAEQTQWEVERIDLDAGEIRVVFFTSAGVLVNDRVERATAVLNRDAPADIKRFVFQLNTRGMEVSQRVVLRDSWAREKQQYLAAADRFAAVAALEPGFFGRGETVWTADRGPFSVHLAPTYNQNIGGPNGFVMFGAGVSAPVELRLGQKTWVSGSLDYRIADNYGSFDYDAPSNLPRVRTDLRHYLISSRLTMPNLQLTRVGQLARDHYFSAYAGYLEYMYAGYGAEWLYRPWHSPLALGVDINHVRQRDYRQDFALRDYTVNTGHATLYWDTGWKGAQVKLSAGQYLAGDRGVTLDVSRMFRNGTVIGVYATKTNVSAEQFGEGSFDKGFYLKLPFDVFLPMSSTETASINWSPLTRDGGAKLGRSNTLYELTRARSGRSTQMMSASRLARGLDDPMYEWESNSSLWSDLADSVGGLGKRVTQGDVLGGALVGTGMVLFSSLLDKDMANWANNHQGGNWDRLGKLSSNIPILLAGGTGMLFAGAGGSVAADTAWQSIKAAGTTLLLESAMKGVVNRSRPEDGLGPTHFGDSKQGTNSSFPSVHMGVAYALVTPFAQRYGADWLYVAAGATAFGRVQERQHYWSDVVAGGLIGYGMGSYFLEKSREAKGPTFAIGADKTVRAFWTWE